MDPGMKCRVGNFLDIVLEVMVECTAERSHQV